MLSPHLCIISAFGNIFKHMYGGGHHDCELRAANIPSNHILALVPHMLSGKYSPNQI
jgi:hypothetical protein